MIVVSEFANVVGRSMSSSSKTITQAVFGRSKLYVALSAGIANFSTSLLFAGSLPEGGTLTYGQGQVTQTGKEMTITQSSAKMAMDWNSFNIGQGNKVTFVQPSSSSVAMNRVTGTDVSVIQGSLQANGQVFLSNPNGVLFTKDAQVNVGSLVATTLQMSNEDLAAGRYRLQGKSDKSVTNQGSITASGGDGKGGGVALVAAKIINEGSITADRGTVALAAANKVTLDLGGPVKVQIEEGALNALIEQGGAIKADGGTVIMSARAASNLMSSAINHTGVIEARSMTADANGVIQLSAGTNGSIVVEGTLDVSSPLAKAGRIEITGQDITLKKNSHLIASGDLGGGTVLIGGDWQGSGSLQQAKHVVMEQGSSIDASALTKGDGGKVVLWSDVHDHESVTTVMGDIWAEGGALGGDGGKVETSGHKLIVHDVMVSTYAPKGKTGEWLLDPYDIVISNSADQNIADDGNGNLISSDSSSFVSVNTITSALARNHVTVSTGGVSSAGGEVGDITVQDDISESGPNTLTLHAANNININANITRDGGGNVTLIADAGGVQGVGNITIHGAGSMLTIDQGGTSIYEGYIHGETGLTKNGSGNLTLQVLDPNLGSIAPDAGDFSTFTGDIFINAGMLRVANSQNINTGDFIAHSSSLGDPSVAGRVVNINDGGTLSFAVNDSLGSFLSAPALTIVINRGGTVKSESTFTTLADINLNGGTLFADSGAIGFAQAFNLNGNVTVGGTFPSTMSSSGSNAGFHLGSNISFTVNTTSNGNGTDLIVYGGLLDKALSFAQADPSSNLVKLGNGTMVLAGENTYSGTTTIQGGILQIGAGGTTGNLSTSNIVDNAALAFNTSNNRTYGVQISGTGSVSQIGTDTLILSGNNTYTGSTTIQGGILQIGAGGTTGNLTTSNIVDNAALVFNTSNNRTYGVQISGTGSVTQIGTDNVTLSNANTYTGITSITSGQIIATNANALGSSSAGTVIDSGGLVVTGSLVVAEPLSIKGTGVNGNGAVISTGGSNTLSGDITLQAASTINSVSGSSLNITGAINGGSLLTANGSGNYTFGLIGNSAPVAGLNITTASNVSFLNSVTSSANITVQASGNITINGSLAATNSTVKFNTTGAVTENGSGSITANSLALLGVGANYTLNSSANNVSIVAADTGTIAYKNADALTIGTFNPIGITATGPVLLSTLSGNLTVSQNISTTDTSINALILNAGLRSAAGTVAGGDIVLSGAPTINVGAGGRATLFSGSVAGTTALATAVGNASLHFRYGSDEASSNFTTALGTGQYLIYRERPVINLTATNDSKTYDRAAYVINAFYGCSGCVNGDTVVNISYTGSAQGAINAGSYSITPVGDNLAALGYLIGSTINGSLTISPRSINASGAVGLNKTYDGTNIISGGRVDPTDGIWDADRNAGNVNISGAPVYSNANAGARSITQGSVALSGAGAANYNLVWTNGSGTINKAPLTIQANNSAKILTETDPTGYSGASYTGFVNGETSNVLAGSLQLARTSGEVAGNYVLTPSGHTSANYNLSFVAGNFEIIGADRLVVSYQNASSAYGTTPNFNVANARYLSSTNNVIVQLSAPVVTGNQYQFFDNTQLSPIAVYELNAAATTAQKSTSNTLKVGNYDLIASNISVTSPNFSNNLVIVGTRTVTPKVITNITGINPVKEYDGSLSASITTASASFTEKIPSDVLTLSNGVGLFTDKNVGTNKQVNLSGLILDGADKDNYVLLNGLLVTTGTINPAPISASGLRALNKAFDGNTNANIDLSNLQLHGLVVGEAVTLSVTSATFSDALPGSNKLVTFSAALAGADAGNYVFTGPASTTATILGTNAADTINNLGLFAGAIHSVNTIRTNIFDRFPDQVWGMRPDSRLSYVDVSENDVMSRSGFENQEFRNQLHTDQVSTTGSDNKDNVPIPDSWSKLSGIVSIRVVRGGIKQPEFEEDFQEVRRYGNGR